VNQSDWGLYLSVVKEGMLSTLVIATCLNAYSSGLTKSVPTVDKGRICLYMKLCNLILLSMILQLELRVNKDH
jgi:hypothetical protein